MNDFSQAETVNCVTEPPSLLPHVEQLEKMLRMAAGLISTMPGWADKHPQAVMEWLADETRKDGETKPVMT